MCVAGVSRFACLMHVSLCLRLPMLQHCYWERSFSQDSAKGVTDVHTIAAS